jgi:hypothetical protein
VLEQRVELELVVLELEVRLQVFISIVDGYWLIRVTALRDVIIVLDGFSTCISLHRAIATLLATSASSTFEI